MKPHEKKLIKAVTNFNGVYLSGFYIQNPATITALGFLFEQVYLPNQLELVIDYAKTHIIDIENTIKEHEHLKITNLENENDLANPFEGLNEVELTTAKKYLLLSQSFCIKNHELFPKIFITDMLENNDVFNVKLVKKGVDGDLNKYRVKINPMTVSLGGLERIKEKLERDYVPIIGKENISLKSLNNLNNNTAIAAVLAMKSIEMLLPSFKSAHPQEVLEARDKLSDFLPAFWGAMLKLSIDSKRIIRDCSTNREAIAECQNIVDTLVRPALVELISKMEKERKNWFFKILSPVANTVKLFIGNPMVTQSQLIKSSFALATNTTSDYLQNIQKIDDLKNDSGLTYLLEISKHLKSK